MNTRRLQVFLVAAGLMRIAACASAPAPEAPPCAGFEPPQLLVAHPVLLPTTYVVARLGADVVSQIVVDRRGAVLDVKPVHSRYELLAPYAELSLQESKFTPAKIEGNLVASRCLVTTAVGAIQAVKEEPAYDTLWAYVPGGESREARWQLRDSVRRLTLSAHIGSPGPHTEIVALAPSGPERVLFRKSVAAPPAELTETVRTGDFFDRPGDYRLELRVGGKTVASTTFTIAEDAKDAVVNACEPLARKK